LTKKEEIPSGPEDELFLREVIIFSTRGYSFERGYLEVINISMFGRKGQGPSFDGDV